MRQGKMIAVVNYGIGNLRSLANALDAAKAEYEIVDDPSRLEKFEKIIVPGVGAFGACIGALVERGFKEPVLAHAADGKPLLGICVGMQMLATVGEEFGEHEGLNLIQGRIVKIPRTNAGLRLPHVGWNSLEVKTDSPILADLGHDNTCYFVHSFHFQPDNPDEIAAVVNYGGPVIAAVAKPPVFGVQFHPEKSQNTGLKILNNFWRL
jgi:glutamine amidotransferase